MKLSRSKFVSMFLMPVLFVSYGLLAQRAAAQDVAAQATPLAIHDGDTVVFYGDSITAQRLYTADIEAYVLTRFPAWKVSFHNAGVGGDKVSGGNAGPIDLRLNRDVFPLNPTVVTIMLGMNDGYYRQEEPGIFSTYADGFRHIVDNLQTKLPQARITLIQPSPYDDVTRPEEYPGGYNGVLLKDSDFLAQLSREKKTQLADLNTPVVAFLKILDQQSPDLAQQLIPDRVHPQQGGHWLMAESLLKSWGAPALVSSVSVEATGKAPATVKNAQVADLRRAKEKLSWTETESALPLPFPPADIDPVLGLTVKLSDLVAALDQETLQVHGLAPGTYDLSIDDRKIGSFSAADLTTGVNLATLETPMLEQSRTVATDTARKNDLESQRFDIIYKNLAVESSKTAAALAAALPAAIARQHTDAQPRPHRYELVRTAAR